MPGVSMADGHETIVRRKLREGPPKKSPALEGEGLEELAGEIANILAGYDVNVARVSEDIPPIVIVRVGKFILYIVPLPPGTVLTATEALHIIADLLPLAEKVKEHGFKPTIIFYSRKGRLTRTTYLLLGSIIEAYGVGILFINGDYDEILEVVWSLENKGMFVPEEEDSVQL